MLRHYEPQSAIGYRGRLLIEKLMVQYLLLEAFKLLHVFFISYRI